jgi:hypothetical protein
MPHSFVQNYVHVVFSTKERETLLSKPMQPKLWAYMAGIARNHDFLVAGQWRHGGPCASAIAIASHTGAGQGHWADQGQFIAMDRRAWN